MTTAQNGSFSPDLLDVLDVLIVGAGPCGLAVAARLQEETPSAIFTDEEHQRYHWIKRHSGHMALVQAHNKKMNGVKAEKYTGSRGNNCCGRKGCQSQPEPPSSKYSTLVLDGSGDRWMERWNRSFRTLEIEQLRSPMFFHVDPGDRDGMLAFTMENGREKELWEIPGCVGQEMSKHKKKKRTKARITTGEVEINERDRKDYFSPSTKLFQDYCSSVASRYGLDNPGQVLQQEVADIKFDIVPEYSSIDKIFTVTTKDDRRFYSRTVVLAIGPGGPKIFPWQLSSTEEMGACHSLDIKTFPSPDVKARIKNHQETNVVVVGGGLSSAQVVDMAIRKGITKVWFFLRGELKVKHFDIDLPWMGKFRNFEKAVFWTADDEEERLQMIQKARNGGSITPRYHKILKQHVARGRLSIHTHTVIVSKEFDPSSKTWTLTTDPPIPDLPRIDYIYFATGAKSDVSSLPCLQNMNRDYPIDIRQGLPCITDDLMWKHGVPLFVTGRLAALQLGPGAANLEGARLGAERIAWMLEEILGDKDESKEKEPSLMSFAGLGNRYAGLFDTREPVARDHLTREL
ncbi:hypothetical protein DTO166G4_4903 [Paecilomyces variotii]|nr:hypothetical protein DTO166G4_4903 [Paecilomyces variotii]KAJ9233555.1 hypothetical protein DTO166G5_5678 [Paecilomyces variotii]KAJ9373521.1 hypothetical protein DTO282E5_1676 [Paecilomyces variotii]KAJ9388441.1 hypothetical protein DTO063F5_2772 [Paecilomyces variotii]